jgi:hypothetical protein
LWKFEKEIEKLKNYGSDFGRNKTEMKFENLEKMSKWTRLFQ